MKALPLLLCCWLFSCAQPTKFTAAEWLEEEDGTYPKRLRMSDDLTRNHRLKNLKYKELVELLGLPDRSIQKGSGDIYYPLLTDYGHDIDPVRVVQLHFTLNQDSVVTAYEIQEWSK